MRVQGERMDTFTLQCIVVQNDFFLFCTVLGLMKLLDTI